MISLIEERNHDECKNDVIRTINLLLSLPAALIRDVKLAPTSILVWCRLFDCNKFNLWLSHNSKRLLIQREIMCIIHNGHISSIQTYNVYSPDFPLAKRRKKLSGWGMNDHGSLINLRPIPSSLARTQAETSDKILPNSRWNASTDQKPSYTLDGNLLFLSDSISQLFGWISTHSSFDEC